MSIKIKENDEYVEYNGFVEKYDNKYYVTIEVSITKLFDTFIKHVYCWFNELGDITLVNCQKVSFAISQNNPGFVYYKYESNCCITGTVETNKIKVKILNLYFKEADYFFIKNRYKIDFKKIDKYFILIHN